MQDIDHHYTANIICPFCGREYSDSWEFGTDEEGKEECDTCYQQFSWSRFIDISYTTHKLTGE